MDFKTINSHRSSPTHAFESLCNQLFERWLRRTHGKTLLNFFVVNGAGGDGGIEAYGILKKGDIIGIQAKFFTEKLSVAQVNQIIKSINTAKKVRPKLNTYIVCLPRDLTDLTIVNAKTGKTAENTDRIKTQKIIADFSSKLNIVFWGEHELRKELELFENIGTRKLWFEHSIIDLDKIAYRNDVAKGGWLQPRYVPDLHVSGFIQDKISKHLYVKSFRNHLSSNLRKVNGQLKLILDSIEKIQKRIAITFGSEFSSDIKKYIKEIDNIIRDVNIARTGLTIDIPPALPKSSFFDILEGLELPATLKNEKESLVNNINNLTFSEILEDVSATKLQYLIFSGMPGSGKTHALANATDLMVNEKYPAIIIQAKYTEDSNLGSILKYGFASFQDWAEEEILSALEALAHSCEAERARASNVNDLSEPIRAFIALDGVDEAKSKNWEKWKDTINALAVQTSRFPRIQFVISCRKSYDKAIKLNRDFPAKFYELPDGGDVLATELFEAYTNQFNAPNDPWIKYKLRNLLALKLFCKLYENKRDTVITPKTSLTALIKEHLFAIEAEINHRYGSSWAPHDHILAKVLPLIAELILKGKPLEKEQLKKKIVKKINISNREQTQHILDALCEHGILNLEVIYPPKNELIDEYVYKPTYELILEFLIASKLANDVYESAAKVKSVPADIRDRDNIIQMASDMLISDYHIVPGENKIWRDLGLNKLEEITNKSIPEAPAEIAEKYAESGKMRFLKSAHGRNQIFKNWIITSAGIPDHPFSPMFLHKILSGIESTYKRDLIWSGPDYSEDRNAIRIADYLKDIKLDIGDKYDNFPLIFAWSLTSVDNVYREYARTQLVRWAHYNLMGLQSLLELIFDKYDPQLDEDLALVVLGVASLQVEKTDGFKELSKWIAQNVFHPQSIKRIKNALVRHCFRAFMEKAYNLNLINSADLKKTRPPYVGEFEYLPLDIGKPTGMEGERYPISGDLGWYVIKDSFEDLLKYNSSQTEHRCTYNFLQLYKKNTRFRQGPYEFAVAAGIAYIKSLGWKNKNGYGYTSASHGSLSEISTFEEKYTWIAVNYIKGYLADHVPFKSDDSNDLINDYNKFLKVKNPANDVIDDSIFPNVVPRWIIPTELAPTLEYHQDSIKEDIKTWVESTVQIDLKSWYELSSSQIKSVIENLPNKKWLVLDNYTSLEKPGGLVNVSIKSTAFLIREEQFEDFLSDFEKHIKNFNSDFGIDHLHTRPDTDFYISPIDAIWMNWVNEYDIITNIGDYDALTAITEIVTTEKQRETYYKMPSKRLRRWLGISSGNGRVFLNGSNKVIGLNSEMGESYYDNQKMLLIDKLLLDRVIKRKGYMIVWSSFVFKKGQLVERTAKEFYHQNCELSLVWQENDSYRSWLYHKGYNRD